MKAPSADYTPISRAIGAKASARAAAYSAMDAKNWKNRYKVQEDSLQLNRDMTNLKLVTDLASAGLSFAETTYRINEQAEANKASDAWSGFSNKANLAFTQYGKDAYIYEDVQDEEGNTVRTLAGLNPDLMEEVSTIFDESFGDLGEWSEKYRNNIINNSDSLIYGFLTQAQASLNNRLAQANATDFGNDMEQMLMESASDVINDNTVKVELPDGSGGTYSKALPIDMKSRIDAYYDTEQERTNAYVAWGDRYQASRGSYILNSAAKAYKDGSLFQDPEAKEAIWQTVEAHAETIEDPIQRQSYLDSAQQACTQGIIEAYNNLVAGISDHGEMRYNQAQDLSNMFTSDKRGTKVTSMATGEEVEVGKYLSIFEDNPLVAPSTLTTIRTSLSENLSLIEAKWGTEKTAFIQDAVSTANAKLLSGADGYNSTQWSHDVTNAMMQVYEADWMDKPEAQDVFFSALGDALPDWGQDTSFQNALNEACNTLWSMDYSKLTGEKKTKGDILRKNMLQDITRAVLKDPEVLVDPTKLQQELRDISRSYTAKYFDSLEDDLYTVGAWDAAWKDSHLVAAQKMSDVLTSNLPYAEVPDTAISEGGYLSLNQVRFKNGIGEAINTGIEVIGQEFMNMGWPLESPGGALVKVDQNADGSINPVNLTWFLTGNMQNMMVSYDLSTGKITTDTVNGKPSSMNPPVPEKGPDLKELLDNANVFASSPAADAQKIDLMEGRLDPQVSYVNAFKSVSGTGSKAPEYTPTGKAPGPIQTTFDYTHVQPVTEGNKPVDMAEEARASRIPDAVKILAEEARARVSISGGKVEEFQYILDNAKDIIQVEGAWRYIQAEIEDLDDEYNKEALRKTMKKAYDRRLKKFS